MKKTKVGIVGGGRFGMTLVDLSDIFANCGFFCFTHAGIHLARLHAVGFLCIYTAALRTGQQRVSCPLLYQQRK